MKKWLLIFSPLLIFSALLGISYLLFFPTLERKVLSLMKEYSKQLPVDITAQDFNLVLFPPGGSLSQIKITSKQKTLPDVSVVSAEAHLDLIAALTGRFQISDIEIDQVSTDWNLDPLLNEPSSNVKWDLGKIFKQLNAIPLSRVKVIQSQIRAYSKKLKLDTTSRINQIVVAQKNNFVRAQIYIDKGQYQWNNLKTDVETILDVGLSPTDFNLAKFYLHSTDDSSFFKGKIQMAGTGKIREQTGSFHLLSEGLEISPFQVGQINLNGDFSNSTWTMDSFTLKNPAGNIELKNFKLSVPSLQPLEMSIASNLHTSSLDIHELLKALGVGEIPVWLEAQGNLDCHGPLVPNFNLSCSGGISGQDFRVAGSMHPRSNKDIVRIEDIKAQGELSVDTEKVSYSANLTLPNSVGKSGGDIFYKKGFQIRYETPALQFSDVEHLANLKLTGVAEMKGSTKGDSHSAVFSIQANGKNITFEDYTLGNFKSEISYAKGHLFFEDILGKIGQSEYQGSVDVDLNRDRLAVDGILNPMELSDFHTIFAKRFNLPVDFFGKGQAQFFISTPFNVKKISFEGVASVNRGTMAQESFESAKITAIAKNGLVEFKNFSIKRLNGSVQATGTMDLLNNAFNTDITGTDLRLEDSDNISKLNSNVTGLLNFEAKLRGPLAQPDFHLKSQISNFVLEDQEFPSSEIELNANRKYLSSKGQLFGKRLIFDFTTPLNNEVPFYMKLSADRWNFTTLFGLIGAGGLLREFDSEVTGTLDLKSNSGQLFKSSGTGILETFSLKRGLTEMRNKKPMRLSMDNGSISLDNFRIENENSFAELTGNNFSSERLDVRVASNIDLRFAQIITPFLDDLTGRLRSNVNLRGSLSNPEVFGTANLEQAFARFKGFPHALERMDAQINFSQSKIAISDLHGTFGGGILKGEGLMEIKGPSNIPTRVTATVSNANINFPDRMKTSGDMDIMFSGNWFPFTLAGTYNVQAGDIEKEFGGGSMTPGLKQSSYLPQVILQKAFEPIVLDLNINIPNPIRVKNSMVDGRVTGALQIKGNLSNPGILGKVTTERDSKLIFRDKVFEVNNATVEFSDPSRLNPDLYVSARSRVKEYDINLVVQGNVEQPIVRVTSVPPLSDQDIISLLALGVTSQDQVASKSQEEKSYNEIGAALLGEALSKTFQDTIGWEFQITSQYNDNNVASPKATLSKKVTDKLNTSVSRTFGNQSASASEVKLQYFFNPNVSAVGSWENREATNERSVTDTQAEGASESIFGLDLEYKKEFK